MTDPTQRALRLLSLLQQRATWKGHELSRRLGVTTRTVRRDVDRLRGLGYVVDSEPGADGGYALGHGTVVPPLLLDADEAVSVTVALAVGTASGTAGDPEAAARALTKLDAALPAAVRERVRGVRDALSVRAFGAGPDAGDLTLALEAVRRRQRLRFGYRAASGEETERWVEPVRVVARGRRWYVWAFDVDRRDWRSFRLDRMASVALSDWEFRPHRDLAEGLARLEEPMPWAAHAHGVRLLVRATPADAEPHLSPASGELVDLGEGTLRYTTGVDDPDQAAAWLAWLPFPFTVEGDDAVVDALRRLADRLGSATATPRSAGRPPAGRPSLPVAATIGPGQDATQIP